MKNRQAWQATKYVFSEGRYTYNPDPKHVGMGSRFMVSILAECHMHLLQAHARGRLLDLGCGNVPCYQMYRDLIDENICVDWENTLHKNPYIDHWLDLSRELALESGQFDTILCSDVLEHIATPQLLVGEMARMLKPGGKLILTVPFFYWLHEEPFDYYRYTRHALQRLCDDSQLQVLELEPYGGALEVVLDIVAKNIHGRYAGVHLAISRFLHRSRLGKGFSRRNWGKFPLGYALVAQK